MRRGCMILLGFFMLLKNADAQIVSDFSVDADGWTAADNGGTSLQTVVYNPTGGSPGGGYISMTTANPQPMFWYAPSKFLGNKAYTSYGETLTFNVLTEAITPAHGGVSIGDVVLTGGFYSIHINVAAVPSGPSIWTPMSVTLHESANWGLASLGGPTATRAQIIDVLTNLTTLKIYVAWKAFPTSNTLGAIDNVVMNVHAAPPAAPVITGLSTTKAAQGSNITINGTGFGANAAANVVHFGKKKATIVSASPTSITVTVPVGADYGPIIVTNLTTHFSAESRASFTPMFASDGGARIIKSSFTTDVKFTRTVGWLGHGDINGDGRPELLASQSNFISIYENISSPGTITTGSFAPRIDMSPSLPDSYVEIDMADLDGDGKLDLFVAYRDNPDKGRIGVLRNIHSSGPITSGSFATPQEFDIPPHTAVAATAADLDGDGRPEIISWGSSCAANPINILQNISTVGDINFTTSFNLPGSSGCSGRYEIADLDLDGKLDIVETMANKTRIVRNTSVPGTLSFEAGFELPDGGNTTSVGDIDNDGRPDIVFASGGMKIYKNISTPGSLTSGSFAGPVTFAGGVDGAKIADLNGDGKPDVIVGGPSSAGVYENVAVDGQITTSSFRPFVAVKTNNNVTELEVFDIDVDGRTDIVSNNGGNGLISINQNVISFPPTVTNIIPNSGSPGSTVTITGTKFGTVESDHTVYFGAAKAVVTNASTTSLEVIVPDGATHDQVSVALRGYTIFSPQFFDPTFSGGSSFNAASFASSFDLTLPLSTDGVTAMDYDGDGRTDIVSDNNAQVTVFRNIGSTTVIDATTFATSYVFGHSAQHLKGGDFDGDGKPDLTSTSYIYKNVSDGSLPNPITFDAQVTRDNGPGGFRFGPARDLNNDGKIDIYYTVAAPSIYFTENLTSGESFIGMGVGPTNSFNTAQSISKPSANGYTVAADFDGDGFNDIAATSPDNDNFTVYQNVGQTGTLSTASFTARGPFTAGDLPQGIAAFDFDGDGKIDLAIANAVNSVTATVSVFRNTSAAGTISFTKLDFPAGPGATDIAAADLDGDGKPDLVVTNANANSFSIFKNTSTVGVLSTSSFAAKVDYPIGSVPRGLVVADIDNDLRADIIIPRVNTIISIFKNLMPLGPIISFTTQPQDVTTCQNATATMSVTASGASNLGYQWQIFNTATSAFDNLSANANYSGVTTATLSLNDITAAMNGKIYRVRVTGDGASAKISDQVTLTAVAAPGAPTTSGATECKGTSLTLTASGGTNGNYRWFDSPGSQHPINGETNSAFETPVLFETTTFYAAIANASGCVSERTPAVATISPLTKPSISSPGTLLCGVNTVEISGPAGFAAYHWSNGESTQNIEVSFAGSYSLIVEDANGCQSLSSDPIFVTAGSVPKPVILSDKTHLCTEGDQAILTAPEGYDAYEWSTGATTQSITITTAASYNVRVTNSSGCRSETSDDLQIGVGAQKPVISVGTDVLVSTPAKTYQWYYGDFLIPEGTQQFLNYNPFQYGAYSVAITDFSDCASTSDVFVNLVTGMEQVAQNDFVHPSPFVDILTVSDDASLFDTTGKMVKALVKGENDVSQLSRGLYLVIIKKDNELKTIKVSK